VVKQYPDSGNNNWIAGVAYKQQCGATVRSCGGHLLKVKRGIAWVQPAVSDPQPLIDQKRVRGPRHGPRKGSARAIASDAAHQPSQALRPGRWRQKFRKALQRA